MNALSSGANGKLSSSYRMAFYVEHASYKAIPFFFRLLSNAFSDFRSVGKIKKNAKIKLEKESRARRPGTSA